jgi:eukaryotic-like serine/threonine-protein kinase
VFGDVFWEGAVASLLGGTEARGAGEPATAEAAAGAAGPCSALLATLVEQEVVLRREASTFPGEVEYAFRHALLREAAYAMLAEADRALGHRLAAAWLGRAGEGDAVLLAEHHLRGGEPERAAGFFLRAA